MNTGMSSCQSGCCALHHCLLANIWRFTQSRYHMLHAAGNESQTYHLLLCLYWSLFAYFYTELCLATSSSKLVAGQGDISRNVALGKVSCSVGADPLPRPHAGPGLPALLTPHPNPPEALPPSTGRSHQTCTPTLQHPYWHRPS